jgi:hypothetical protein
MSCIKRSFVTDKKAFFGRQADRQTERQTERHTERQTDSCHIPSMVTFLGQMYQVVAGLIIIFTFFEFFFSFAHFYRIMIMMVIRLVTIFRLIFLLPQRSIIDSSGGQLF